jgi:hypothetical protein
MSRTKKDLRSHKRGFGEFWHKPTRKMSPFIHKANKIVGKNEVLVCQPDNDIKQDEFNNGEHWHDAKAVRALRKQLRAERDNEKSTARTRIKQYDKKNLQN